MNVLKQYNSSKLNLLLTGIISLACGWSLVQLQLPHLQEVKQAELDTEDYLKAVEAEKLNLDLLANVPTFGFDNLVANWSMLQFLQYLGDGDARSKTGYSLSYKYLEVIAKKDPRFTQAYIIISPASSMFGGTPHKTVSIMDRGLQRLTPDIPQAYFVWLYKGVDEILYIGDLEKARKSYEKAAEWAKIAGDERIAKSASDTAKFLATNPDPREAQVGAWFMVWTSTKEEAIRSMAKSQIERLGGELIIYPNGQVVAQPPKIDKS